MIEIQIPKDISKYKTKLWGFSVRQLVICGAVLVLDFILYAIVFKGSKFSVDTLVYIMMAVDIPPLLFAVDVQGLPMERFISQFFICNVIAPIRRKNISELGSVLEPPMKASRKERIEKKRKKMNRLSRKKEEYKAYQ